MDTGIIVSGLLCGVLFGYVLENAGFGSGCKLQGQFQLRDWSVFKVMFPAVLVAAIGLEALRAFGLVRPESLYIPTTALWPMLLGGGLVGAGMAVGGYCPGTSAVGFASGRVDALVFLVGLVAGTWVFALAFPGLEGFMSAGQGPERQTLGDLLGVSNWVVLAALVAAAAGGFFFGGRMERSGPGPVTVDEALGGER